MRRVVSVLAAVALLVPAATTRADPALAACGWNSFRIPVYSSARYPAGIESVAAVAANDVWAAGFWTNPLSGQMPGLVLRWNGTAWRVVPFPGSGHAVTYSIAALGGDVWAVGQNAPRALILHWTGNRWVMVSDPTGSPSSLEEVTIVSPHDVWAIGSQVVLHWNGARWSRVAGPDFGQDGDNLGVARIPGTTAVWIYGLDHSSGGSGTSVARWTGSSWQKFRLPGGNTSSTMSARGIAAASASSAWIGFAADNGAGISRTVMLHWDGSVWARVSVPNPGGNAQLAGLAAVSGSSAWAVGTYLTSGSRLHSFVLHWNGSSWSIVPAPGHTHRVRLGMGYISIPGASAVAPVPGTGTVWVTGGTLDEYRC